MWKDGGAIGKTRQLHEAADESVEGGGRADIDAGKDRDDHATNKSSIERVVHTTVDARKPAGERGRFIAGDGPQSTTSSDIAACACNNGWKKSHNE